MKTNATNIQIGLAYAIGKVDANGSVLFHIGEILGEEYETYVLTKHDSMKSETYVLYRDLGEPGGKKLCEIDDQFTLQQIIHVLEEMIQYDKKDLVP